MHVWVEWRKRYANNFPPFIRVKILFASCQKSWQLKLMVVATTGKEEASRKKKGEINMTKKYMGKEFEGIMNVKRSWYLR